MRMTRRLSWQVKAIGDWAIWSLPRWLTVYVIAIVTVALAAIGVAAPFGGYSRRELALFGLLLVCAVAAIEVTKKAGEQGGLMKDVQGVWELLVAILLVVITAVFGKLAYQASVPSGVTLVRFLIMLVVGAGSFCALGFAISTAIPNADAAPAVVNASILPLLFLSGIFIPIGKNAPAWIVWIARVFPVRHFALGMQSGFLGTPFDWVDVAVVAAWGVAGLLIAILRFSWEPKV